jgi:lysozyme
MSPDLRNKILAVVAAATVAGTGAYKAGEQGRIDDAAIKIAREVGSHYESSGRHIGKPYIDRAGKGQPWTVCAGVTGPAVVPSRYYTPKDCERLETAMYRESLTIAKANLTKWSTYNPFVRASFLDVAYNVPSALVGTTLQAKANAGDLVGACMQMQRWVYGTVNGQKVRLNGLIDRRGTTRELCAEWGRDGHFSAGLIAEAKP